MSLVDLAADVRASTPSNGGAAGRPRSGRAAATGSERNPGRSLGRSARRVCERRGRAARPTREQGCGRAPLRELERRRARLAGGADAPGRAVAAAPRSSGATPSSAADERPVREPPRPREPSLAVEVAGGGFPAREASERAAGSKRDQAEPRGDRRAALVVGRGGARGASRLWERGEELCRSLARGRARPDSPGAGSEELVAQAGRRGGPLGPTEPMTTASGSSRRTPTSPPCSGRLDDAPAGSPDHRRAAGGRRCRASATHAERARRPRRARSGRSEGYVVELADSGPDLDRSGRSRRPTGKISFCRPSCGHGTSFPSEAGDVGDRGSPPLADGRPTPGTSREAVAVRLPHLAAGQALHDPAARWSSSPSGACQDQLAAVEAFADVSRPAGGASSLSREPTVEAWRLPEREGVIWRARLRPPPRSADA